jgi:hypothetical protein
MSHPPLVWCVVTVFTIGAVSGNDNFILNYSSLRQRPHAKHMVQECSRWPHWYPQLAKPTVEPSRAALYGARNPTRPDVHVILRK